MRLQNWFIRNLDDIQREVIIESIEKSIIVQGPAGSGKTNLAIHRANQAKGKGSYAIVVMTPALKRMIAYGMKELGLDCERIAYSWAWENRGFDLVGDVYYCTDTNNSLLYLVSEESVRKFSFVGRSLIPPNNGSHIFGLDFADWVSDFFYGTWGRRVSWYSEVSTSKNDFSIQNSKYKLVPSGTLFKPMPKDKTIDYLIIDEAQDFKVEDYQKRFIPKSTKSISLLGDSNQKMIPSGASIQSLKTSFPYYKSFELKYNYRLPKTVAKVAEKITPNPIDLTTNNLKNSGNSDYPLFPKPIIKHCASTDEELKWIANKILIDALDDVAILVKDKYEVQMVVKKLSEYGIEKVQTFYRTRPTVPYQTVNTLDFSNNEIPCILDYYAAKGSEFDYVFVPFADQIQGCDRQNFYVACTRASHLLHITYSGQKPFFLNQLDKNDIVEL